MMGDDADDSKPKDTTLQSAVSDINDDVEKNETSNLTGDQGNRNDETVLFKVLFLGHG